MWNDSRAVGCAGVLVAATIFAGGCGRTSSNDAETGAAGAGGGAGAAGGGLGMAGNSAGAGLAGAGGRVSPEASESWSWTACGSIAPFKAQPLALAHHPSREEVAVVYEDGQVLLHEENESAPRVLRGSSSPGPSAVAISRDGEHLALAIAGVVEVRRFDGELVRSIAAEDCPGAGLRFSFESDRLMGWSSEALCIWQVADGALLHRVIGRFTSAALNGNRLVAGVLGTAPLVRSLTLPGLAATELVLEAPATNDGGPISVEVSPRGDSFAGAALRDDASAPIWLWSSNGTLVRDAFGTPPVYSPDGNAVFFGEQIFEPATGTPIGRVPSHALDRRASLSGGFRLARFEPIDENVRVTAVYDGRTGQSRRVYGAGSTGAPLRDLAVSNDGKRLATGHDSAMLWQLEPNFIDSRQVARARASLQHDVDFSPVSELLVCGDGWSMLSEAGTEHIDGALPPPDVTDFACYFTMTRVSPFNRWLAIGEYSAGVRIRERGATRDAARIATPSCNARVAFSADERFLATTGPTLYRTSDWSLVWPPVLVSDPPTPLLDYTNADLYQDVAFVPGDTELLVSHCGSMPGPNACRYVLHSATDGALIRELPEIGAHRASISGEGHWVVSGRVLLHLPTQTTRQLEDDVAISVFTPDGDVIAALEDDTLVRYCRAR